MSTKYGGEEINEWPEEKSDGTLCAGICGRKLPSEKLLFHRHIEGCEHMVCQACFGVHVLAGPHLRLSNCKKIERLHELKVSPSPYGSEPLENYESPETAFQSVREGGL